jgi:hypothetical protein
MGTALHLHPAAFPPASLPVALIGKLPRQGKIGGEGRQRNQTEQQAGGNTPVFCPRRTHCLVPFPIPAKKCRAMRKRLEKAIHDAAGADPGPPRKKGFIAF